LKELANDNSSDPKAKFREALEKKKSANSPQSKGTSGNSKVRGGQSGAGAPKMFRRKSGSS
jgi:hypothetical protein